MTHTIDACQDDANNESCWGFTSFKSLDKGMAFMEFCYLRIRMAHSNVSLWKSDHDTPRSKRP